MVASYVATRVTEWGENQRGQTYGIANENGTPDLVAVMAESGRFGYAYAEQLDDPSGLDPQNPGEVAAYTEATRGKTYRTPVYEADGQTRVCVFTTKVPD